jgi:serine phosphatase RsbU (regulator of sigma subunit)
LNDALSEQTGLWLCTAVCVRLEREQAVIASAGHPAPLIVRGDGRVREIGAVGPILGAWTGDQSVDRAVSVAADETLFLYTDGVIDALGAEERFGSARLKRLLAEHAGEAPEGLLRALAAGLDRFQVGPQADDTAALALRPTPVAAGAGAQASHPTHGSRTLPVT